VASQLGLSAEMLLLISALFWETKKIRRRRRGIFDAVSNVLFKNKNNRSIIRYNYVKIGGKNEKKEKRKVLR